MLDLIEVFVGFQTDLSRIVHSRKNMKFNSFRIILEGRLLEEYQVSIALRRRLLVQIELIATRLIYCC